MLDYEKLYHKLFNDITDTIWLLENRRQTKMRLLKN